MAKQFHHHTLHLDDDTEAIVNTNRDRFKSFNAYVAHCIRYEDRARKTCEGCHDHAVAQAARTLLMLLVTDQPTRR